ncbi:hypothetical protein D7030_01035, partial [Flavobacteriaceae bacterium AU392]
MKRTTLLTIFLFFFAQIIISQEISKRILIPSTSDSTVNAILQTGIDLRCGATITSNSIELELSETQIKSLEDRGITYTVLIEDVYKAYSENLEANLEIAKANLAAEQGRLRNNSIINIGAQINGIQNSSIDLGGSIISATDTSNSSIVSTAINNYLQYEECDEVDWATPVNFNLNPNPSPNSFGGCLTVSQVEAELDQMRALFPNLISVKMDASPTGETTLGNTLGAAQFPGQTVYYVRISDNPDTDEVNEPEILYTSMIHAREVSSLMGNLFYMWYLLENYSTDSAIKNLVDNNELYFVPIVNPDGLRWNEVIRPDGGGQQRKNLRVNPGDSGSTNAGNDRRGVDLNRNFDYLFGTAGDINGSSGTFTADSYRGTGAFSEPESRILRDFVLSRNFETALMHHSAANSIPHPYGGIPTMVSGRESEMHKWHEDMTKFNRYVSGATIFPPANGIADDWMLGGVTDGNGSVGSGRNILASTPEHGHGDEGGAFGQFWPNPVDIVPIAKRAMRINLMNAYYGGQYAKLQDLTQSNISTLTSDLEYGIERLGQTSSNFTLTITPVSSNITSIASIPTQTGMTILEQRNVTAQMVLDPSIQPNEKIEYRVQLANNSGTIFYDATIEKIYQPTVLLTDSGDNLNNWTVTGGNWTTSTVNPFSGARSISTNAGTGNYPNNANSTLTSTNSYDFSGANQVLIQFYTRWDLERNFDFVEIEGSTNGTTWQSLCGIYNKPEAPTTSNDSHGDKNNTSHAFQQNNSSGRIYDGDQMNKWVLEQIVIDPTHNNFLVGATNAQIRFRFRSDANNMPENYKLTPGNTTYGGFFIDDFTISRIDIPCVTSVPTNLIASTIGITDATITWDNIPSATYDLRYREVGTPTFTDINNIALSTTNITGLDPNTQYEVQVRSRCTAATSAYSTLINFTTLPIPPCTGPAISSYPYTENFDGGIGLWTQATGDDGDWILDANGTPSGGTGPNNDFTGGQEYFYIESSDPGVTAGAVGQNATVNLISPCIDLTGYENANFSFYYHMFGANMGDLFIDVSIDNGNTWLQLAENGTTSAIQNPRTITISNQNGQQQSTDDVSNVINGAWRQQLINLSNYDNQVIRLRFSGITGGGFRSDMAIDQINITADIVTSTTWYADTDMDTFGDPTNTTIAVTQPLGFVADNTDCDDTDANINPNTIWYIGVDGDSDGFFGSTTSITQCTSPGAGYSTTEPAT